MPDNTGVSVEQFNELQQQFSEMRTALDAEKAARSAAETKAASAEASATSAASRLSVMEGALRLKDAQSVVQTFATRIPPAAREKAVALLLADGVVKFSDAETPVAELFREFISELPVYFAKPIGGQAVAASGLTPEQEQFRAKHFPDMPAEDFVKFGLAAGEVK